MYQVQYHATVATESEEKAAEDSDMVKRVSKEVKRFFFKMKCDKYLQNELKGGHLKVAFDCLRGMDASYNVGRYICSHRFLISCTIPSCRFPPPNPGICRIYCIWKALQLHSLPKVSFVILTVLGACFSVR